MSDISVVIPARNAAATIDETLRSVLASQEAGEVIVVDDGSTDNTVQIALDVGDLRVRVLPGPQAGVAAALNAGLFACTKPFIARCDADDLFPPGRLTWQRSWLVENPEYIAVSGGFTTTLSDGTKVADLASVGDARDVTQPLLRGEPVTTLCSWLIRTDALSKVHGAREWFASAEDLDLQFRLAEVGRVWHVPRIAYLYRLHDASITHGRPTETIQFYDTCARRFAKERREHGQDSLQAEAPPVPPALDSKRVRRHPALDQAIGHAIGAAWAEFSMGQKGEAYYRLHHLALTNPCSLHIWRQIAMINYKYFKKKF